MKTYTAMFIIWSWNDWKTYLQKAIEIFEIDGNIEIQKLIDDNIEIEKVRNKQHYMRNYNLVCITQKQNRIPSKPSPVSPDGSFFNWNKKLRNVCNLDGAEQTW